MNKTNVSDYWVDKNERRRIAYNHTIDMANRYINEIQSSVEKTEIWDSNHCNLKDYFPIQKNTTIIVDDIDSVNAIFKYWISNITVLNFASYTHPGGRFLNGSKTQEECLCHQSFLYNVLKEYQNKYYNINANYKNKGLYLCRALWCPNIIFTSQKNRSASCNVITCAAPNKRAAQKYNHITNEENYILLKERIDFVLKLTAIHNVDTFIAGAFGCGAFGQDPKEVASIFKELLTTKYNGCFNYVIFAIPQDKNGNLNTFKKIMER